MAFARLIMSRVSVLIPVYKGERFIALALQSALSQTHTDLEIIIVNDGSPDNSEAVIQPFLADPRVHYIKQANAGVAAARNAAIKHATGDYFALLDQDDLWHPEKLARQIELFKSNPRLGLVHCHAVPIDAKGNVLSADPGRPRSTPLQAFTEIFIGNPIQACAGLFSREALEAVGEFDAAPALRFADEYDLWLRIAGRFEVGYVADTLAYYRLHGENNSADIVPMVRATLAVLAKARLEHPALVSAIPAPMLQARFARLFLNLAACEQGGGKSLAAVIHALRAWLHAPGLATSRWLGPQRLDRWHWRLARMRKFFNGGGMQ